MAERILVVDDDEGMLDVCEVGLRLAGFDVATAASGDLALQRLETERFDLVITDLQMPGKTDGHGVVTGVKALQPFTEVIVVTGAPTLQTAISTLKDGAYDYVLKPFDVEHLKVLVRRCLDHRRLRQDLDRERTMRQEMETAYQELQKVEQLKESFLGRISHELKTPLTEILLALDLLGGAGDPAQRAHCLELARTGARRLDRTLGDLLAFVDVQRQTAPAALAEVDLERLCAEQAESLLPLWKPRCLDVSVVFDPGARRVRGDAGLLGKAFRHLLHNAVMFNREGGRVAVRGALRDGRVAVSVSDTGEGIPEAEFQGIFDSFYQIAAYLTRKVDGLGLGLAITRRIVEAHGGEVSVASKLGEGSTFTVLLPPADLVR